MKKTIKTFTFKNICKQMNIDFEFTAKQIELYCTRIYKSKDYWERLTNDLIYLNKKGDTIFIITKELWEYKAIKASVEIEKIYKQYNIDYKKI